MAITFTRGSGGLGRPLAGEDHISGLAFYLPNADLPAGFSTSDRKKVVYSLAEAETLGIVSTDANVAHVHYQISEFFRMNPKGVLYIGLFTDATVVYADAFTLLDFASGTIRQLAIIDKDGVAFSAANVTTIDALAMTAADTDNRPLSVLYTADFSGVSDLSALASLRALTDYRVSVVLGQDASGAGNDYFDSLGISVTQIGAALGCLSAAKVHESIAWREKFNISDGTENETAGFGNGDLVRDKSVAFIAALAAKGYIFGVKDNDFTGTYFNDSHTSVAVTSDYAYIENVRSIDKAIRSIRTFMLPNQNAPVYVTADGTLTEDTVAKFKADAERGLIAMVKNGELSAQQVIINPAQDVLSTSTITITVELVPVGVARTIAINIGFTLKLSA